MSTQDILMNLASLQQKTVSYYMPFSLLRFIKGLVINTSTFVALLVKVAMCSGYMSTRISGVADYRALAAQRAQLFCDILNPAAMQCKVEVWSGKEYMTMWYIVLVLLKLQGKPLVSFNEDLATSRGCNLEVLFAKRIGMTVIHVD